MTENTTVFDGLVIGLAALLKQTRRYPFPALFQYACHALALSLTARPYPETLNGLLDLMHTPLHSWWPLSLPIEFDSDYGLLYEGNLSEEASRYLYQDLFDEAKIPSDTSSVIQQIALDNFQFKRLIERLKATYETDSTGAQQEYTQLRCFLIEHPYTTPTQIHDAFYGVQHISVIQVGSLYGQDLLPGQSYWTCERCGPLTEQYGQLRGINPRACADHHRSSAYVRAIPWQSGLRRISLGIHWRTCLPGLPELRIFRNLQSLQRQYPQHIDHVHLWPGVDRYDLQIRFTNGTVWAADIKDYHNPYKLASHLIPIYGEGNLHYNEGFYIVPSRRLSYENYLQIAREQAKALPTAINLVSDTTFEQNLLEKLTKLQKGLS